MCIKGQYCFQCILWFIFEEYVYGENVDFIFGQDIGSCWDDGAMRQEGCIVCRGWDGEERGLSFYFYSEKLIYDV